MKILNYIDYTTETGLWPHIVFLKVHWHNFYLIGLDKGAIYVEMWLLERKPKLSFKARTPFLFQYEYLGQDLGVRNRWCEMPDPANVTSSMNTKKLNTNHTMLKFHSAENVMGDVRNRTGFQITYQGTLRGVLLRKHACSNM